MKSSRFGMVAVILLVFTFVFWSVPAESGAASAAAQGAASATVSAARDFDIVGLKLGMTVSEVEAAIKKYNSGMSIRMDARKTLGARTARGGTTLPVGDYVDQVYGSVGESGRDGKPYENISVKFFRPPDSNVALGVDRRITFAESEMPTVENVKAAIFKKYGEPTHVKNSGIKYYWLYYADGKPVEPGGVPICGFLAVHGGINKAKLSSIRMSKVECGLVLTVELGVGREGSKRGLVGSVSSTLGDFQASLRDKINTDEFVKNYLEQQQKDEQKAAEGRSAPSF